MTSSLAPICLFVYGRLEESRRTVQALQANFLAPKSDLHIFSDGPKPGAEAKVHAVRTFIREIDGFKSVTIHASPENRGLARSIISGVTQILSEHSSVIVLEDDLLTSPNFLDFMNHGLAFYQDNPKVLSISGYSFPLNYPEDYPYDATFGIRASSWGWATWRNRWETIDWDCSAWKRIRYNPLARWRFNRGGSDMSLMLSRAMRGRISSWAIRFSFHQFTHELYDIFPVISKVDNIGLNGSEGENCNNLGERYATSLDKSNNQEFQLPSSVITLQTILSQFRSNFSYKARAKSFFLKSFEHITSKAS